MNHLGEVDLLGKPAPVSGQKRLSICERRPDELHPVLLRKRLHRGLLTLWSGAAKLGDLFEIILHAAARLESDRQLALRLSDPCESREGTREPLYLGVGRFAVRLIEAKRLPASSLPCHARFPGPISQLTNR
jgi:hypothetical protein